MNLAGIRPGDLVACDVRGRTFTARVLDVDAGSLRIDPPSGITYHLVTARQVRKRLTRDTWNPSQSQVCSPTKDQG